jgi:hypothetical protein
MTGVKTGGGGCGRWGAARVAQRRRTRGRNRKFFMHAVLVLHKNSTPSPALYVSPCKKYFPQMVFVLVELVIQILSKIVFGLVPIKDSTGPTLSDLVP